MKRRLIFEMDLTDEELYTLVPPVDVHLSWHTAEGSHDGTAELISAKDLPEQAMPTLALVTVSTTGCLMQESTCTIDGKSISVPARSSRGSSMGAHRILDAIRSLGYHSPNYLKTWKGNVKEGYFEVEVEKL